jgi:segregation and condensation protein B
MARKKKSETPVEENIEIESSELAEFGLTNIFNGSELSDEAAAFLPDASDDEVEAPAGDADLEAAAAAVEGSELEAFESAQIEETEFVETERLASIVESVLFASDRPVSLASLKLVFKGTNVKTDQIRRTLDLMATELAGANRGVSLEEVPGGYQLRTKVDNMEFLNRAIKARQFKLSGPALEVLSIIAYKQPIVKNEMDSIRGVESGHLLRALMEKGLVTFEGKSELPGKPMLYGTTKKFLEIFGLRNLKELPTLSQIDELLPEGMTEEEAKPTLSQLTDSMSQEIGSSYSDGEEELTKITDQLTEINSTSEFFEQEKVRMKLKADAEKAQSIRDAMTLGEEVSTRERNWLEKWDLMQMAPQEADATAEEGVVEETLAVAAFDQDADLESASTDLFEEEESSDDDLNSELHDEEI